MKDLFQHFLIPRALGTDIVLRKFIVACPCILNRVDSCWGLLEGLGGRIEACIFIVGAA